VIGEWTQPESEAARSLVEGGIGTLDLRRASVPIGSGAVAPGWLFSPGLVAGRRVLQPGAGKVEGRYVRSTPETVHWGTLPGPDSVPAATVESGALVTIDTVSHEGILADQGRDPVAFFARHGIAANQVLADAKALAASSLEPHGPRVVSGPVAVRGAAPGDILKVDVLGLVPRVPYGVISARQAVSTFTPVHRVQAGHRVQLRAGLPLDPCLGIVGVAGDPLTDGDGLGVGSSLFVPVRVPGAKFFAGDPHYARDGAHVLEAPLRASLRLTVLPRGTALPATQPAGYWATRGRVDALTTRAIDESLAYLTAEHALPRALAFAYLAAATRAL
jgi:acetamidase/formamidase